MTTENLPADWAITKALELMGSATTLADVKRFPAGYPNTIRVASYIEQHKEPPVDPLLIEAREICAKWRETKGYAHGAAMYREGGYDDYSIMKVALAALRRGIEIAGLK